MQAARTVSRAFSVAPSDFKFDDESKEYNISRTITGADATSQVGIDSLGIKNATTIYKNLTYEELFEHEKANNEGVVAKAEYGETFTVDTGKFTGRSPKDKWIVRNVGSDSDKNLWWGDVNQSITPEIYEDLYETAINHMNSKEKLYVADVYCGASEASKRKVRFVHELAWQQHFVTNMFIRPEEEVRDSELQSDEPISNYMFMKQSVCEEQTRYERKCQHAACFAARTLLCSSALRASLVLLTPSNSSLCFAPRAHAPRYAPCSATRRSTSPSSTPAPLPMRSGRSTTSTLRSPSPSTSSRRLLSSSAPGTVARTRRVSSGERAYEP